MSPVRRRALGGIAGCPAALAIIYVLNVLLDHSLARPLLTLGIIFAITVGWMWLQDRRRR